MSDSTGASEEHEEQHFTPTCHHGNPEPCALCAANREVGEAWADHLGACFL